MNGQQRMQSRRLEGRTVSVSLSDGSRLDGVALVSSRRGTLWIYDNGGDRFLAADDVVDLWECPPARTAA